MTRQNKCVLCERTIPPARIEALPDTAFCRDCSEEVGGETTVCATIDETGAVETLRLENRTIQLPIARGGVQDEELDEDEGDDDDDDDDDDENDDDEDDQDDDEEGEEDDLLVDRIGPRDDDEDD